jgi:predicted glycoside hydrolase/deacetylase ChbG (UPF0249 family)
LRIGLHLTLLEGTPVAPLWEIPNLVDARGQLRRDLLNLAFKTALSASMRRQFRREIAAQFSAYRRTGLPFDHVSSRKQFHVHPLLAAEVVAACREFGVPALRVPREPATAHYTLSRPPARAGAPRKTVDAHRRDRLALVGTRNGAASGRRARTPA